MGAMASQITSLTIVYSTVYSGVDQRKPQSPASLALVPGIHRWPVNSPNKGPVTRKMFPFDDVIMVSFLAKCHKLIISDHFLVFYKYLFFVKGPTRTVICKWQQDHTNHWNTHCCFFMRILPRRFATHVFQTVSYDVRDVIVSSWWWPPMSFDYMGSVV